MVLKESEAKEIYSILDRFYGPMRYFTPYTEPAYKTEFYRYDTDSIGTRP
jgi:hypothetical protein